MKTFQITVGLFCQPEINRMGKVKFFVFKDKGKIQYELLNMMVECVVDEG